MQVVVVSVPAGEAELAADLLWSIGVRAVEERIDVSRTGWTELRTVIGADAQERVAVALQPGWRWRVEVVDDEPLHTWKAHARPVTVANSVMIIPAWLTVAPPPDITAIWIEPGASFGLGDHPTTQLAVGHLLRALEERPGARVLDVGCGSGVVSIVAGARGAREVRAIDISDAAADATRENAARNDVVIDVDTTPIADLTGSYDVVVANILAPVLVSIARDLQRLCRPDGRLVLAGILANRHDHVVDSLAPMQVEATTEVEAWAGVTMQWPSRAAR